MSKNPTSILASFATMKSLVDAQQYQSPYQILAEFIQYIIIKSNLHSFTAVEMKNRLFEVFGFDVIAYLLDDQQTTTVGKYTDLIRQFILKNESDEKIQSTLTAIREDFVKYLDKAPVYGSL